MDTMIRPIERHLTVIKEIGSKCVIGLATINAAPIICILANYNNDFNEWIETAIVLFGVGATASILIGLNTLNMFLKYYKCAEGNVYAKEYSYEKDIERYNKKIDLCFDLALFLPTSGLIIFLHGTGFYIVWPALLRLGMLCVLLIVYLKFDEVKVLSKESIKALKEMWFRVVSALALVCLLPEICKFIFCFFVST